MKKIVLFSSALFALCTSTNLQAQKKKSTAPVNTMSVAKDPVIKEQNFRLLGPFRGGRAAAAVGSYSEPNTFYMGSTGGGIWKSTDAGTNWKNISDGYFGGTIGSIAIAPSNESIIYVGEGENHIALYQSVVFVPAEHIHFLQPYNPLEKNFKARIRYRQTLEEMELHKIEDGYYFFFQQPQRAIAPGQFIAWYKSSGGFDTLTMHLLGSGRMSMR